MPVVLDTGPLIAYLNKDDALHPVAEPLVERILRGTYGVPVTTEFVLSEGLTFLRRRPGREALSRSFLEWLQPPPPERPKVLLRTTPGDMLREAAVLHLQEYARGLSFTDCSLIVHARRLDAVVATHEGGFEGLVTTVRA